MCRIEYNIVMKPCNGLVKICRFTQYYRTNTDTFNYQNCHLYIRNNNRILVLSTPSVRSCNMQIDTMSKNVNDKNCQFSIRHTL